jgi:hypothetical protein
LWGTNDFKAVCSFTIGNWQKKERWLAAFRNSAAAAQRS